MKYLSVLYQEVILIFGLVVLTLCAVSGQKTEIELKNGFYYIDRQKFLVKGIGYEVGAYPGMVPWNHPFNEDILRSDLLRIREGGYNTIRTWTVFTDEEMKVVHESGLKIIMGIWIDPAGDFSDPDFVNSSLQMVGNVLAYTHNYDNIIGYLIMNEPLPDHIFEVGFQYAYTLWMRTKRLIHEMHPGIPVSFANTCVGDFIDPEIFDFSAYNIYPYNPSTVNRTFEYPAYVGYIHSLRQDGHPLVVTEFGLSVSPSGEGNWGYGGNSPEEQAEGILFMYRSLIDGGAGGACVFNYSDGWWKSGDEFTHDDAAEEWFGLVEYSSLSDTYGKVRPAWDSLKRYMQAIIVSPKNQEIYENEIPVEIFSDDTVTGFMAEIDGEIKLDTSIIGNYYIGTIPFRLTSVQDIQLNFTFYNALHQVLKNETIHLLVSNTPVPLPEISIDVMPQPVKGNYLIEATYSMTNTGPLKTDSVLDYSFYTHNGWDYGVAGSALLTGETNSSYTASFSYADNVDVITLSAGLNASYGRFIKRIAVRKDFIVGDTSYVELPTAILKNSRRISALTIQPNPASDFIIIGSSGAGSLRYSIYTSDGILISCGVLDGTMDIDIRSLTSGYYLVVIQDRDNIRSYASFIKK